MRVFFSLAASVLKYSTEGPPVNVPEVAKIRQGPSFSIFSCRSLCDSTFLKISDKKAVIEVKNILRKWKIEE